MATNSVLARLAVVISANNAEFSKALNQTSSQLKSFGTTVNSATSGLTKIAGAIGIAFSARAVANFTIEVAKLAGEAEGVRAAFDRLPDSVRLMSELKDATAGTVSELALMKRTVQAANFGIALESLPKLLEFAAIRAQQTGQSVDYLVDSIITGIGRKSPLILDNLGISAVRLKGQFNGAALEAQSIGDVAKAVGRIAEEELKKMGDFSENTSTKIQRLGASWEDLKVAIGNAANSNGVIGSSLNMLTNFANALAGDELTTGINQLQANISHTSEILSEFAAAGGKIDLSWQELMARGFARNEAAAKVLEERLANIQKASVNLSTASKAIADAVDPLTGLGGEGTRFTGRATEKQIETLASLQAKVKELNDQFTNETDVNDKQKLANIGNEIQAYQTQIDELEKLRRKQKEKDALSANSLEAYRSALADLNKEYDKTNKDDVSRLRVLREQINGTQELIDRLERLKNLKVDIQIRVPDLSALLDPLRTVTKTEGGVTFDLDQTLSEEMLQRFKARMADAAKTTKETTDSMKSDFEGLDLRPLIINALEGIGESLGNAIAGVESFGRGLLKTFASVLTQFGRMLIQAGVGLIVIKRAFQSLNGYIAIAAGVALVALGTALGASVKGLGNQFGSGGGGGSSSSINSPQRSSQDNRIQIELGGKFVVAGKDMQIVLSNQNVRKQITG